MRYVVSLLFVALLPSVASADECPTTYSWSGTMGLLFGKVEDPWGIGQYPTKVPFTISITVPAGAVDRDEAVYRAAFPGVAKLTVDGREAEILYGEVSFSDADETDTDSINIAVGARLNGVLFQTSFSNYFDDNTFTHTEPHEPLPYLDGVEGEFSHLIIGPINTIFYIVRGVDARITQTFCPPTVLELLEDLVLILQRQVGA